MPREFYRDRVLMTLGIFSGLTILFGLAGSYYERRKNQTGKEAEETMSTRSKYQFFTFFFFVSLLHSILLLSDTVYVGFSPRILLAFLPFIFILTCFYIGWVREIYK